MTSGSRVQIQPPLPRKTQALSLRAGGFFFCLTWGLIIGNYPLATGGGQKTTVSPLRVRRKQLSEEELLICDMLCKFITRLLPRAILARACEARNR